MDDVQVVTKDTKRKNQDREEIAAIVWVASENTCYRFIPVFFGPSVSATWQRFLHDLYSPF